VIAHLNWFGVAVDAVALAWAVYLVWAFGSRGCLLLTTAFFVVLGSVLLKHAVNGEEPTRVLYLTGVLALLVAAFFAIILIRRRAQTDNDGSQ
jgi:thiol:disulfide interchange protein